MFTFEKMLLSTICMVLILAPLSPVVQNKHFGFVENDTLAAPFDTSSWSDVCYLIDDDDRHMVYAVDPGDLSTFTPIGPTAVSPEGPEDWQIEDFSGGPGEQLYAVAADGNTQGTFQLGNIDLLTGDFTPYPNSFTDGNYYGTTNMAKALTYDPLADVFYFFGQTNNANSGVGGEPHIVTLNAQTGAFISTTLVTGTVGSPNRMERRGSFDRTHWQGATFYNGMIYAIMNEWNTQSDRYDIFYEIDPATGVATELSRTDTASMTALGLTAPFAGNAPITQIHNIENLSVLSNGSFVVIASNSFDVSTGDYPDVMYDFDINTGDLSNPRQFPFGTYPGNENGHFDLEGMFCNPNMSEISLLKSISSVTTNLGTDSTLVDAGDQITYTFEVTNTGETHLGIAANAITDAMVGSITCPVTAALAPNASITCTADNPYIITAADVTAGGVENTALVTGNPVDDSGNDLTVVSDVTDISDTGTDPDAVLVTDPETTETPNPFNTHPNDPTDPEEDPTTYTIPEITLEPSISLIKSITDVTTNLGTSTTYVDAGDEVTYSFEVTNTGDTHLAIAANAITDAMVGAITCPATPALAPNASVTCTADSAYTLTPADVAAGGVENTATVTANPVDENGDDLADTPDVSDISDTGTDPEAAPVTEPEATETPNPFDVHPNNPDDPTEDPTTYTVPLLPRISLIKSITDVTTNLGTDAAYVDAGDEVTYGFEVTNTGQAHLFIAPNSISDAMVGAITCPATPALAPNASVTCTADSAYTLTPADVAAGGVENTALVTANPVSPEGEDIPDIPNVSDISDTGTDPETAPVTEPEATETPNPFDVHPNNPDDPTEDPTTYTVPLLPSISLIKSISVVTTNLGTDVDLVDAGDHIFYSFELTNTGATHLAITSNAITDPLVGSIVCPVTPALAPNASVTCPASGPYTITSADVTAGGVENTALVTANPVSPEGEDIPDIPNVTDISDTGTEPDAVPVPEPETTETPNPIEVNPNDPLDPTDDPTTFTIPFAPRISLQKTGVLNGGSVGDTVTYSFVVTNTGNVDLTDVTVVDPLVTMQGGPLSLLRVGESDTTTFTGTYVLTQADIDRGYIENTATTEGKGPGGKKATDTSDDPQDPTNRDDNDDGEPDDPTVLPLGNSCTEESEIGNKIFEDVNCNGKYDKGIDEPLEDITVKLKDEDGNTIDKDNTNSKGKYELRAPGTGRYQVVVDKDDIDKFTYSVDPGSDSNPNNKAYVEIDQCGDDTTKLDFGFIVNDCELAKSGYDTTSLMCVQ